MCKFIINARLGFVNSICPRGKKISTAYCLRTVFIRTGCSSRFTLPFQCSSLSSRYEKPDCHVSLTAFGFLAMTQYGAHGSAQIVVIARRPAVRLGDVAIRSRHSCSSLPTPEPSLTGCAAPPDSSASRWPRPSRRSCGAARRGGGRRRRARPCRRPWA